MPNGTNFDKLINYKDLTYIKKFLNMKFSSEETELIYERIIEKVKAYNFT